MTVRVLAFTERGLALGQRIAEHTGGTASRCGEGELSSWTRQAFEEAEALIFVGACGIAVRAIAPFVQHKAKDPAVLVVDETGRFVIPILSGHIGGANALAQQVAADLGAQPVITTATDSHALFAVDVWAKAQGCVIPNPQEIKRVSSRLLRGERISFFSEFEIGGTMPAGIMEGTREHCDFALTVRTQPEGVLACVPRIVVLGIGCKKGTSAEVLEERYLQFLTEHSLQACAIRAVATIDRKKDEPGLLAFCRAHGWSLESFSSEELSAVPGDYSSSAFVQETVGVDNVCERSAVCGSGGRLLIDKDAGNGVTIAAALAPFIPEWM